MNDGKTIKNFPSICAFLLANGYLLRSGEHYRFPFFTKYENEVGYCCMYQNGYVYLSETLNFLEDEIKIPISEFSK